MMYKRTTILLLLMILSFNFLYAKKRFESAIFSNVDSLVNIPYGHAVNIKGQDEELLLDIIMPPKEDKMKKRPLLIYIHGGGFSGKSKTTDYSETVCISFAMRGYVTATINYRLGVEKPKSNTNYAEAMYRTQQDGKAAVRFFKKNAAQYGIDTTQIFIMGSSSGGMTCLALAYMDEAEVPADIDQSKWGTLEGNSGNEGYSSKVQGVINCWGAMLNYNWIKKGDAPLFNVAGTADKSVPYDSSFDYHGFKYGSYILYQHCQQLGIATGWRPFYGNGHSLNGEKIKQNSSIQSIAAWLYPLLKIKKGKKDKTAFYKNVNIAEPMPLNNNRNKKSGAAIFTELVFINQNTSSLKLQMHG